MMIFREELEANEEAKEKFDNRHKGLKKKPKPELKYMMINPDGSLGNILYN